MTQADASSLLLIGGLFIFLGLVAVIWDRVEKRKYLNTISHRVDTREFLDGWPPRPQFGALKTGGWIAVILGIVLLVGGGILHLWG
jgi:hypothetical protein